MAAIMTEPKTPTESTREGFSPAFWTANVVELLERAAWYGVFVAITLYLSRILEAYAHAHYIWFVFVGVAAVSAIALVIYGRVVARMDAESFVDRSETRHS